MTGELGTSILAWLCSGCGESRVAVLGILNFEAWSSTSGGGLGFSLIGAGRCFNSVTPCAADATKKY